MIVFGAALLVGFVAPWSFSPTTFSWTKIGDAPTFVKIQRMLLVGTGILALVFAFLPVATLGRGIAAVALGTTPIVYDIVGAPGPLRWRPLVIFVGMIIVVGGLLLRSQYKSSSSARIFVTVGAALVLVSYLLPDSGAIPVKAMFEAIADSPGKVKPMAFVTLMPFFLALLSLIVWIPAPSTAAGTGIAWAWILWPIALSLATLIASPAIGKYIKANMHGVFWRPIAISAWITMAGYGFATIIGKQNEA